MKQLVTLTAGITIGLITALAAPAIAFDKAEGRQGGKMAYLTEELGLSEAQVSEIKALHMDAKEDKRAHKEASNALRESVKQAVLSGDFSSRTMNRLRSEVQSQGAESAGLKFDYKMELAQVLTPEQRVRFMEMKKQHRQR